MTRISDLIAGLLLAMMMLAAADAAAEVASLAVSKTTEDYTCFADAVSLVEKTSGQNLLESNRTQINIADGKLNWSFSKTWKGTKLKAKAASKIILKQFGVYNRDTFALVGAECPVSFESLNHGLYPNAVGSDGIVAGQPTRAGCTPTAPAEGETIWACSNELISQSCSLDRATACTDDPGCAGKGVCASPLEGGTKADFPNRSFCVGFKFTTKGLYGFTSPTASDATFSPIDFPRICGGRGPVNNKQLYGITVQFDTLSALDPELNSGLNDDLLEMVSELTRFWWQRDKAGIRNGEVVSKTVNEQVLRDGRVKTTIVYLFQRPDKTPANFVAGWR